MTRLKSEWIEGISSEIFKYEDVLNLKVGLNLLGISAKANNIEKEYLREKLNKVKVAAIPISAGKGRIRGFSESVIGIITACGGNGFVTDNCDVKGIKEAINKGAEIIFMADEDAFIAFNIKSGNISDNNKATARGFSYLIDEMCGGIKDKDVLVMGYGIIGEYAADYLYKMGARISIYDIDKKRCEKISKYKIINDFEEIKNFGYVFDATNKGNWLRFDELKKDAYICAPGIPLSFNKTEAKKFGLKLFHDNLNIGVAVMLGEVILAR